MDSITANSPIYVGAVAVFEYKKSGLKHVAVVEVITDDGFYISESNYQKGVTQFRFIPFHYKSLLGFSNQ